MEKNFLCTPPITHLQYLALRAVLNQEAFIAGLPESELTDGIEAAQIRIYIHNVLGIEFDGPKFYQFMARLEESGHIVGRYTKKTFSIKNQPETRRIRVYDSKPKAKLDVETTERFYTTVQKKLPLGK